MFMYGDGTMLIIIPTSIIYVEVLCCRAQMENSTNCKRTMLIIFSNYLRKGCLRENESWILALLSLTIAFDMSTF